MKEDPPKQIDLQPGLGYHQIDGPQEKVPAVNWRVLLVVVLLLAFFLQLHDVLDMLVRPVVNGVFDAIIGPSRP